MLRHRHVLAAMVAILAAFPAAAQTPLRIGDTADPRPADRVFFTYNYFQPSLNPAPFSTIQRETVGFERTFLDGGAMGRDVYISFQGGASFAGSSTIRDTDCGAQDSLFGCDGGIDIDGATGGGFRVELGTSVARGIRVYVAGQGNYFGFRGFEFDLSGPTPTAFRANGAAHTITTGLALDSAGLFPTLLPPRWNVFLQGGIGVSFNTLSGIEGSGTGFTLTVPSGTSTNFAGEVGGGVEYALGPGFIATLGYNSLWVGDWNTSAGTGLANATPFVVGAFEGGPTRIDQLRFGFRILLNRTIAPPPR